MLFPGGISAHIYPRGGEVISNHDVSGKLNRVYVMSQFVIMGWMFKISEN